MNENKRTSMENTIGEVKVSPNTAMPKIKYEKDDGIFAFIYFVLGYTFVRFFFIYDWVPNFDYTFPLYTLAYIFTVVFYSKSKGKRPVKESIFWIAVMLCVAFLFKIENFFRLSIQITVAAYFTAVTGGLYGTGTSGYLWADLVYTFISGPFSHFGSIFPAFFSLFKNRKKNEKFKFHPAVWGGIASVAVLWIIVPLLIQADSNFLNGTTDFINHLFGSFFHEHTVMNMVIHSVHFMMSLPVACYLYSLGYSSVNSTGRMFDKNELDEMRSRLRISPAVALKVFLFTICFVYILFMALQAEYLLGAFAGKLYGSMTYAQYARTGFFELCQVAAINISLLIIANLLIKKEEIKSIKTPMLLLCMMSLLLLATATAKMAMYICAYGLTVKRVISTVFLIWLIVVFVMCIIAFLKPFNIVKSAVITGTVMFCILFSLDIGMISHEFNEKYGFAEKVITKEYNSGLMLPDMNNIHQIDIYYNHDNLTEGVTVTKFDDFMKMLSQCTITSRQSIQDSPNKEEYYRIDIMHNAIDRIDDSVTTLFIYKDEMYFYIEQPYQAISISNYDWDGIIGSYL